MFSIYQTTRQDAPTRSCILALSHPHEELTWQTLRQFCQGFLQAHHRSQHRSHQLPSRSTTVEVPVIANWKRARGLIEAV